MLVIAGIAILLFGADRIPRLARSIGQSTKEFQRGRDELEQELEDIEDDARDTVSESGGSTDTDTNPAPAGDE